MNNIFNVLKHHYHIEPTEVVPRQGGWAALAYKISAGNRSYFLKMYEKRRTSTPKWTALIDEYAPILGWLTQNSLLQGKIPVPLLTASGKYKCEDDEGIYMLYDFIDGETVGDKKLTAAQTFQFSEIITELHSYGDEIPVNTEKIKEHFDVPFLRQLKGVTSQTSGTMPADVKTVVEPRLEQMFSLVERVERLSKSLKSEQLKMVLCHTDLHPWNLMQAGRQLMLIDWEGLRLAPVESDLMFLIDEPYYPEFIEIYRKKHKDFEIHPDALRFYKDRRKLEDIWEFIEQLLFDGQTETERAHTMENLAKELEEIDEGIY
ncbi:aminoglycoside phosphotransferase family protein [Paenibacillus sp. VCA1]|uniref:aminoglycoside phosphotransferase family protein n=1 Tax=Paenibacillus sp. VCA1 TaxID=3039148 RepID=UPI002870D95A|nr:aminoglycoside phosphotransferase family protein [Paenibacillus sp. VCA1]MDR9854038.1 aminoglycoside phosphotransferase family protein [Paenibacillus sp. VCA1]